MYYYFILWKLNNLFKLGSWIFNLVKINFVSLILVLRLVLLVAQFYGYIVYEKLFW